MYYLIQVREDGEPILKGPYPTSANQKESARLIMAAGVAVIYLDISPVDRAPSVGRVLLVDGEIGNVQRLRVEVLGPEKEAPHGQ